MTIQRHTITLPYPCCGDNEEFGLGHNPKARLTILDALPRLSFERTCPSCGSSFLLDVAQVSPIEGVIIHTTTWTPLRERLGNGTFRVNHRYARV